MHIWCIYSNQDDTYLFQASFSMTGNRDDIDINDPEFWQKWAKKADVDVDAGEVSTAKYCPSPYYTS